jgi:hypothetical protein
VAAQAHTVAAALADSMATPSPVIAAAWAASTVVVVADSMAVVVVADSMAVAAVVASTAVVAAATAAAVDTVNPYE